MFHRVLELLCDALLLLGDSVCELVWDDRSLVGMELASQNTTHDSLSYRWMVTLHRKGGSGLATRRFATDTQAYDTQLSRTVGMWSSRMNYVRLQRLSAGYKEPLTPLSLSKHWIAALWNVFICYVHSIHTVGCVKLVCFFYSAGLFVILLTV